MVAGLRNVDDDLARAVAGALGLPRLPRKAPAAQAPRTDLPESPALSILANGPQSFAGRKIGVLVTDGTDAKLLARLKSAARKEAVNVELVAPAIGGVEASDGNLVEADQQVDGGPSVLYDAVIVLPSAEGVSKLVSSPAARDFVTDAYAHCKFIGYTSEAAPLFQATGLDELIDDGFIEIGNSTSDAAGFLTACRQLRYWERQATG